jgi:hypothetical protein
MREEFRNEFLVTALDDGEVEMLRNRNGKGEVDDFS